MLGDIRQAKNVYIVTGYTDMRKGIRSLVPYVMQNFKMDPYESGLFLFCGKKCDRLKALLWEPDGFVLLYKVLDSHTLTSVRLYALPQRPPCCFCRNRRRWTA